DKDHCIRSALILPPPHAIQKIIWYKDGSPVSTVTGTNSFEPDPVTVAGNHGHGDAQNQFEPFALYVDDAGNMYIADQENNRILKWPPGATQGITVAGGNGPGNGPDQ